MKFSAKTIFASVIVLCLVTCALAFGYVWYASMSDTRDTDTKTDMKMEGIRLTLANLTSAEKTATRDFKQQIRDNLGLLSLPLQSIVRRDGDEAIQNYVYGCVLRRDGDSYILPEDTSGIPELAPVEYEGTMPYTPDPCDPFEDREGAFWSILRATEESETEEDEYVLCAYRRLTGQYYYLYYTPLSSVEAFFNTRYDKEAIMSSAETVYGGYFLAGTEEDGELQFFFGSSVFDGHATASELGITVGKGKSGFQPVTIDETDYMYAVSASLWLSSIGNRVRIVYLVPAEDYAAESSGVNLVLLVIAFAFFLVLTVWLLAARRLMSGETVTSAQRRQYSAGQMRIMAASLGAVGFVILLLTSMFSEALSGLYFSTTNCESALTTLHSMVEQNSTHEERMTAQRSDQSVSYARRIATLLGLYPDLMTREQLAEMSETIGADYIMLFDDEGNEILSNSRYVNLAYGTDEASSTYDFRRLIAGVPSIVHEAMVDEVMGLNRQLIGVSMDDGNTANGYGSLIVALKPKIDSSNALTLEDIMNSLTTSESIIFAVDKDRGTIKYATDKALVGKAATEVGMSEGSLRDGFMDFFQLNTENWYGCASEQDGYLYYYAVKTDSVFANIFTDSLIPSLMFLGAYAVLAAALLIGYTEKRIDASGIQVIDEHDWAFREKQPECDEERMRNWWSRKTPEGKAGFVLKILMGISMVGLVIAYTAGGMRSGNMAIIPYVLSGGWTRGFNLFALTRIVLIIGAIMMILLGMRALLSVLYGILDTKGETICRLIGSLIRYALVIVGLFYSLEALGFDTTTLLASLGIFSLALSLGAKDLVADVLSGVMIVFSGEYQIGDIVEIAGFRGRVWEIGVRSTTMVNKDGNMKNISNRNVSNVMNLSRMNSRYNMQVSIPYSQSLDEVKKILDKELPEIGKNIDEIANGPTYLGVTAMDGGYMTLAFCAECAEQNLDAVRSQLNPAIKELFDRHQIPIK